MEALAIAAILLFTVAPLPLCIYLLVKRSSDSRRIEALETRIATLSRDRHAAVSPEPEQAPEITPVATSAIEETPSEAIPVEADFSPLPPAAPAKMADDYHIVFEEARDAVEAETESLASASEPSLQRESEPIPPPLPSAPSGLIPFLRTIGLWPPSGLAAAEAGLMQWWLPRIGGLLATLAVISFAVYISQGTPPWVRFIELVLADAVVLAGGVYFLKRRPHFGSNLIATGLSMTYLSSIAAYAAPPVRVIENPILGIVLQCLVVVAIFLTSVRLDKRSIAIMALVYGFLSSLFSAYVGQQESSLILGLVLYLVGIAFSRKFDWLPILVISTVGAYLPVGAFCLLKLIHSSTLTLPNSWSVLAALMLTVSLLPYCEARWNLTEKRHAYVRLHLLNTSLCLAVGYCYMKFFANELFTFYGVAAIVFSGWAGFFGRRDLNGPLFQIFFLKASALTALWFVNRFTGDVRWFALIIEASLVAWVALRSKSLLQELASLGLWAVSTGIALSSIGPEKLSLGSFEWFLFLSQPLLSAATLAYLKQGRNHAQRFGAFYSLFAIINAFVALHFITESDLPSDALATATGLYGAAICALCTVPWFAKSIPGLSGALLVLFANIQYWDRPDNTVSFLVAATLALGIAFGISRSHAPRPSRRTLLAELLFQATWSISLYAFLSNAFQSHAWFAFLPGLIALGLIITPCGPFKTLREAAFIPLMLWALDQHPEFASQLGTWLSVGLYLLPLFLLNHRPSLIQDFRLARKTGLWRWAHHLLVAFILTRLAFELDSWLGRVSILLGVAIAFHVLWREHKRLIALLLSFAALALSALSVLVVSSGSFNPQGLELPWARDLLIGGLLIVGVAIGLGIDYARFRPRFLSSRGRNGMIYLTAICSFITIAMTLSSKPLWNPSLFTPLMALYCFLLVGIGIGAKIKPYRIVALVGFFLPLARLFLYDIRDTLIRIIAFAILAGLITFIGYLYHRFQSRIE